MEHLLDPGITMILWLQQASPSMDAPFKALTFMGGGSFFLLVLPLVYWCIDRSVGARLALLFLVSNWVNASLKDLFSQPRPFQYDSRVMKLARAGGPGLPSSHTQATVVFWGYLAASFSRRWLWGIAICFMVLVPLSRLYLGVHFPTDLIGGYVLGAALIMVFIRLEKRAAQWFQAQTFAWQLGIALMIPSVLIILSRALSTYTITSVVTLMGLSVGLVLERRFVGFDAGGTWVLRTVRYVLGIMVMMALWWGMKAAFSGWEPVMVLRCVRTLTVVLWGTFGAPWLFVRLGLAASSFPDRSV